MDVIFTSDDLEQMLFEKENSLFINNFERDNINLSINNTFIKVNKNLLSKNFNFFYEKIDIKKNTKEWFNIFDYLDIKIFSNEDLEFLKNNFFLFLKFLFSKEKSQYYQLNLNQIIKFLEICIILEPKNLIIDKIYRIIYLNQKFKTSVQNNSSKFGGRLIKDKLVFLMQKLQSFKNFCQINQLNKIEKENFTEFSNTDNETCFNLINKDHDSYNHIIKSNRINSNLNNILNIVTTIDENYNENLKINKTSNYSFSSYCFLNNKKDSNLIPKLKNSIFFRYSFNLIRTLYNIPLPTKELKNKSKLLLKNDSDADNNYYFLKNNLNNHYNKESNLSNLNNRRINKIGLITNENLEKNKFYHQITYNKQAELNEISKNINNFQIYNNNHNGYVFNNLNLEEKIRYFFNKKNQGFFVFVDSLFNNKNSFAINKKKYKNNVLINILENNNKSILFPNKNYIKRVDSLSTISNLSMIIDNKHDYKSDKEAKNKKDIQIYLINNENAKKNQNKKHSNKIVKKNLENILLQEFTETNKEFSRYFIIKNLQNFDLRCEKATIIQKHFRKYISYKSYLLKIKDILILRLILSITKIQAFYRSFISRKKLKCKYIIEEILQNRIIKSVKIFFVFRKFYFIKKFQTSILINRIIEKRIKSAIRLQKHFRGFYIRKFFNNFSFKEKNFFKIIYPFKAEQVKLKLYIPRPISNRKCSFEILSDEKIFDFEICRIRKIHVVYIDTRIIKPGKYRALMIVDGTNTCDGRYPHVEFSDGFYYNVIDIKQMINNDKNNLIKNSFEKNSSRKQSINIYCNNNSICTKSSCINELNTLRDNEEYLKFSVIKENFLDKNLYFNNFQNYISGDNNINKINNFNHLTDSNKNFKFETSYREELLETRNTYYNQSYYSSNYNSEESNNSIFSNYNTKNTKEDIRERKINDNNNDEAFIDNFNNKFFNNFITGCNIQTDFIENDEISERLDKLSNNNHNIEEICQVNDLNLNFNELKRNLLPNDIDTKTFSYKERLKAIVQDENDFYFDN